MAASIPNGPNRRQGEGTSQRHLCHLPACSDRVRGEKSLVYVSGAHRYIHVRVCTVNAAIRPGNEISNCI